MNKKPIHNKIVIPGLIVGLALSLPALAVAEPSALTPPVVTLVGGQQNDAVEGVVTAKSESGLVVGGTAIDVTSETTFTKGAERVEFASIDVGDHVKVVTERGDGDRLRAVSIEVR